MGISRCHEFDVESRQRRERLNRKASRMVADANLQSQNWKRKLARRSRKFPRSICGRPRFAPPGPGGANDMPAFGNSAMIIDEFTGREDRRGKACAANSKWRFSERQHPFRGALEL